MRGGREGHFGVRWGVSCGQIVNKTRKFKKVDRKALALLIDH